VGVRRLGENAVEVEQARRYAVGQFEHCSLLPVEAAVSRPTAA
jgi:hypothetical protein